MTFDLVGRKLQQQLIIIKLQLEYFYLSTCWIDCNIQLILKNTHEFRLINSHHPGPHGVTFLYQLTRFVRRKVIVIIIVIKGACLQFFSIKHLFYCQSTHAHTKTMNQPQSCSFKKIGALYANWMVQWTNRIFRLCV